MKIFYNLFIVIIISTTCLSAQTDDKVSKKSNNVLSNIKEKTVIADSSDENYKEGLDKKREEWNKLAHKAAPGVDWRSIEQNTMLENYSRTKNKSRSSVPPLYANGSLCGTWREKGSSNQAGRCIAMDYTPYDNALYVMSDAGIIFKGVPDSSNWVPVNDQLAFKNNILNIVENSSGGKRIIAAIGINMFYSDDDGVTFTPSVGINFPIAWGGNYIDEVVSVTDSGYIYLTVSMWDPIPWGTRYHLYSSSDHGETWTDIYTFPIGGDGDRLKMWLPNNQQTFAYILFNQSTADTSTLYSVSGSSSVNILNTATTLPCNVSLSFSGNNNLGVTTLFAVTNQSTLYKSTDYGASWISISGLPATSDVFSVSPLDVNKLFVGGLECYYSYDGGSSWTLVNTWGSYYSSPATSLHADIFNIQYQMRANGTYFSIINCDGGCYRSDDDITSVSNIGLNGLNISEYYGAVCDDAQNVFLGSQDQGLQRVNNIISNTGILPFDQIISGDYGKLQLTRNQQTLWGEYPGGHEYYYYNATGGYTNDWAMSGSTIPVAGWMLATAEVFPKSKNEIYIGGGNLSGGSGSYLIHLTGSPTAISATQGLYNFRGATSFGISAIETTPLDSNRIYVAREDGAFYRSTDAGISWTQTVSFTGPAPQYLFGNAIYASRKVHDLVLYGGSGYSNPPLYFSVDGGITFTPMSLGLPPTLVYGITANVDESFFFAATESGPYVFSSTDSTWYSLSGGITPAVSYSSVVFDSTNNVLHFASFGRGLWDFEIGIQPTIPTISAIDSTLTSSASIGNQWYFNGIIIPGAIDQNYIATAFGNYTVTVDNGGCTATSIPYNYLANQISELTENSISIYPNPTNGKFTIKIANTNKTEIEINNIVGELIYKTNFVNQQSTIDLSNMSKGIYFVKVIDYSRIVTNKKIVVQ